MHGLTGLLTLVSDRVATPKGAALSFLIQLYYYP